MKSDKKDEGCSIILMILFLVVSLVYFFATTSKESIAETGTYILTIIGFGIGYIIFKNLLGDKLNTAEISENKGCLKLILIAIAFFIFVGIIVRILTSSFEFNVGVGSLAIIIIFGLWLYSES